MSIYNLNDHSLLKVSGHDAERFLQGQLTGDVTQMSNLAHLAAHCDRKGRVQSLFRIFKYDDSFYFIMSSNIIDATYTILKKYAVFSKVTLMPLDLPCFATDHTDIETPFVKIGLAHSQYAYLLDFNSTFNSTFKAEAKPAKLWHLKELEAGVARLYPETIGLFLPHDLNLPNLHAISFTKGCYTGQEIVARMQYRGKLKMQLVLKKFPVTLQLQPNTELADNQGTVIDCVDNNEEIVALVLTSNNSHR